jgi:hypothetical protein
MNVARLSMVAALVGALSLVAGCGSQDRPQENATPQELPAFVREPADRAVISSGIAGWPSLVADPCVVADGEGYHLFYTAFFCQKPDGSFSYSWDPERPEGCDLGHAWGATAYAFSRDRGLTWAFRATPVVQRGTVEWNGGDIETPFVARIGGRLLLFYAALGGAGRVTPSHRYQLGAATLELGGRSISQALLQTGEAFVHRAEPVIPADLIERNGINATQEPSVVVKDGRLEMYFVSLGLSLPDQDVVAPGQAVSIALRRAVLDEDLALVEPPTAPLLTGAVANIPEVRYFDGRYHLFATTTELDDHEADEITYAVSDDGRHFSAPRTILSRRGGNAFDNWGLMAPTLVVEPEAILLFYTGWEAQEHVCAFTGANGRMGMAQESRPQGARCLYATLGRAVSRRNGL